MRKQTNNRGRNFGRGKDQGKEGAGKRSFNKGERRSYKERDPEKRSFKPRDRDGEGDEGRSFKRSSSGRGKGFSRDNRADKKYNNRDKDYRNRDGKRDSREKRADRPFEEKRGFKDKRGEGGRWKKRDNADFGEPRGDRGFKEKRERGDSRGNRNFKDKRGEGGGWKKRDNADFREPRGDRGFKEKRERGDSRGNRNFKEKRGEGGRWKKRDNADFREPRSDRDFKEKRERGEGREYSDNRGFREKRGDRDFKDKRETGYNKDRRFNKSGSRGDYKNKKEGRHWDRKKFDERPFGFEDKKSERKRTPQQDERSSTHDKFDIESKQNKNQERDYPVYEPAVQEEKIRLNKFISNSGICSRREADVLISTGVISVNGQVITELGYKISPDDVVKYGNDRLKTEKMVYVLLNKPKDYITTSDDPEGRKTVLELIKGACKERIYPVGRLDRMTSGVLLLTNDGELTKKLTHPSYEAKKIYHVTLDKKLSTEDIHRLAEGIQLDDGYIQPDEISYVGDGMDKKEIGISLHSGRNRIVRRMFEHLGYVVVKLDRVYFAGLTKKDLSRGRWRHLEEKEIAFLKMAASKKGKQ